jgi:hypothetical protein
MLRVVGQKVKSRGWKFCSTPGGLSEGPTPSTVTKLPSSFKQVLASFLASFATYVQWRDGSDAP